MRGSDRTLDQELGRIATAQKGLLRRSQLLAAGVSSNGIDRRLAKGTLIQEYPGVYGLGHRAPHPETSYLAAVYACGEGALLCGRSAAFLFGLMKGQAPPPEVICLTQRTIPGVKTVRTRKIDPGDATTYHDTPVTTVPRTLVDLAAVLPEDDLARACHEAEVRFRTKPERVEAVLDRRPTSKGAANLRAVLRGDVRVALSKLESRFLELLRADGLPLPETNRPAGGRRIDCRWPEYRLTVELDSYTYHGSRHAWERDRRRERDAHARGDDLRRFTHGDVFERPADTLRELRALLGADG
jgi:hypothetical protein